MQTAITAFQDPAEYSRACTTDEPSDHYLEGYCPECAHEVDAVCPKCQRHVESSGATDGYSAESTSDFHRRLLYFLYSKRNSKFTIACFFIATGSLEADG